MTIIDSGLASTKVFAHMAILGLEAAGIAVIVGGALIAIYTFTRHLAGIGFEATYRKFRAALGRTILMGLELLVAADILKSLIMPHELDNLLGLAILMLARTFLSLSLNVEINGHWPWQETRLKQEAAAKMATERS